MITRTYQDLIRTRLTESPNKIVLLFGPRQAGKTTLVNMLLEELPGKKLQINADDSDYAGVFASKSLQKMDQLVDGYDVLFIDEAQRISDIDLNLKILHDARPNLQIIATGSSSFDLANKTEEPLTGRTWAYTLLPIGVCELAEENTVFELHRKLEQFMVYGMYPGQIQLINNRDKEEYISAVTRAYLYKDVLDLSGIRYARKLQDLLKLLAYQIGSEVSISELGNKLQLAKETVAHYLDLLEKSFVIFRLSGFSRNLRKEITKHDKIYFYDLGIRNALIENFNGLDVRADTGKLWENFLVLERMKYRMYNRLGANRYFWRTYTGAELDYVEEYGGNVHGFEFKFSEKWGRIAPSWKETYPESTFQTINLTNYLDFVAAR